VVLRYLGWKVNMLSFKVDILPLEAFCLVGANASEHANGKPRYEIAGSNGYRLNPVFAGL
jgi:hypothetical protein